MLLVHSKAAALATAPRLAFRRQLPLRPRPRQLPLCTSSASTAPQPGVRRAIAVSPSSPTAELLSKSGTGGSVLLLGEGDFSFCRALARLHGALSFTATSFEPEDEVRQKWGAAAALDEVRGLSNVQTLHGIDATKLDSEPRLLGAAFDRVLFSFPHCGVKGQIHRNRDLLAGFFRAVGSSGVLAEGGQVEVTLARGQGGTPLDGERAYGDTWQVQLQAAEGGLVLGAADFFDSDGWRALGYSSRGCYRGLGRGTMEVGFRTDSGVVHTLVREDGRVASPYPQRHEFDMSLWASPEKWGLGPQSALGDEAVGRFRDAVSAAAQETVGPGVVEAVTPNDVWWRKADGRVSLCLRVAYCAPRRALTHGAAVAMHDSVRSALPGQLGGTVQAKADLFC